MITTWSEGDADANMAEEILVELADRVRAHPWWRARARLTLDLLDRLGVRPPSRVLDAGCGWGTTLEALERRGYRSTGLDISRRTLERLDRPGRRLVVADLSRDWPDDIAAAAGTEPEPEPGGGFDAVLALDVIEHLDDDRAALSRLGRLVRPGGWVVASVPALPELFNEFDAIQGHRRRYVPPTLRLAFEGSGLAVEGIFWWGRWLLPLLRRQRGRRKGVAGEPAARTYLRYLALPPWPAPTALALGFALEHGRALEGKLDRGTSLFAVARRPAGAG